MTNDIREFCQQHNACPKGRDWALANCRDMAEVWDTARPDWLIWIATRPGVVDDRTLGLWACWCVRQVWHLLTDNRSRRAVEVPERYADGAAPDKELATVTDAAWDAAGAVGWAAGAAARAAVWAAGAVAWTAAGTAERTVWTAGAAGAAPRVAQVAKLREMVPNPFHEVKP